MGGSSLHDGTRFSTKRGTSVDPYMQHRGCLDALGDAMSLPATVSEISDTQRP